MPILPLGQTGLSVEKNGFGVLPLQRTPMPEAVRILRRAYDGGVRFYDTARNYTDSEAKLGEAFHGMRDNVVIATKTHSHDTRTFWKELDISLTNLRTDYIDIHQFHNPNQMFRPGDGTGMYEAMLEAKQQGKIRHIGISSHSLAMAKEIIASGLFVSLQYPFSTLSTEEEQQLVRDTERAGMAFICMKALSGGLIRDFYAANAFIATFPGAVPIWGVQRENELDDLLDCIANPPALTPERLKTIEKDRAELTGNFCRACNYCQPCPAGISMPIAARMSLLLRRAPMGKTWPAEMEKVPNCIGCGACRERCPYHLDVPTLLKRNYEDYLRFTAGTAQG